MRIEWDPKKDAANRAKHGLGFEDASGPIDRGIITVVYTERSEDSIRIISARRATGSEAGLFRRYVRASES